MNEVIEKRIRVFKESVRKLKEIYEKGKTQFMEDWTLQDSALRNFQVSIEALADIGNHLISEKNWDRPSGYQEIVKVLNERGSIPDDFFEIASSIMGFRNIIVHEYLYLDMEKVFENVSRIKDLEKFLKHLLDLWET